MKRIRTQYEFDQKQIETMKNLIINNKLVLNNITDDKLIFCAIISTKNLNYLDLSKNSIKDIGYLTVGNFENLKTLILNKNLIESLDCLINCNMKKLKQLYLHDNKISNISPLKKCPFKDLKCLDLTINNIFNFDEFRFTKFVKLTNLYLNVNLISTPQTFFKSQENSKLVVTIYNNKLIPQQMSVYKSLIYKLMKSIHY